MKWIPWALATAILLLLIAEYRNNAGLDTQVKAAQHMADSLRHVSDSLSHVAARTDTVWRTRVLPKWDSVRVTDTLVVDSVVYVPRPAADSAIAGCSLALRDCGRAKFALEQVVDVQDSLIKALRKQPKPCKVAGVRCEVLTLVGGLVGGVLIAK